MSGQEVQAPDGRRWVVRRRWAPRLRDHTIWARIRNRYKKATRGARNALDVADTGGELAGCLDDLVPALILLVVVIVVGFAMVFFVVPLLLIVVDLIILLLLTLLGFLGRIVFRRPWMIEASCDDGERKTWRVVGWRASSAHIRSVAQHLEAGMPPPDPQPLVD